MRTTRKLGSFVAAVAVTTLTAGLLAGPATAAPRSHPVLYLGASGGSKVTLANGAVSSALTAAAVVQGTTVPASNSNDIANVSVPGIIDTGAVTTQESVTSDGAATTLTSHVETANVSLLGGIIKADAVRTTATSTFTGTDFVTTANTQFVNLKIVNFDLPIDIASNSTLTIPGVAKVVLNSATYGRTDSSATSVGAGVYITLLDGLGNSPLGSQIYLNPTYSAITTHIPTNPVVLGGSAFGTQVNASVLGVDLGVDQTAYQALGEKGTGGKPVTNSTVGVNLPGILNTGVITTTIRGSSTTTTGYAATSAAVGKVVLLNGLVKVKAIKAFASVTLKDNGRLAMQRTSRIAGLVLAGRSIPIGAAPNTRIDVPGLGTVYLNQQSSTDFSTTVRAVYIVIDTAGLGLPVGATVTLGSASAFILS